MTNGFLFSSVESNVVMLLSVSAQGSRHGGQSAERISRGGLPEKETEVMLVL